MSTETATGRAAADGATGVTGGAAAQTLLIEAPSEERARAAAADQLGVPESEIRLTVLSRQKRGPFGLGGEVLTIEAVWAPKSTTRGGNGTAPGPDAGDGAAAGKAEPETPQIEFACERGRLSLAIHRPQGRARAADITVLDKMIEDWPLDARDETIIQQSLRAQDGRLRVFATMSPSVKPTEDATVAIKVSQDELTAWMIPWLPKPLDLNELFAVVGDAGIVEGLEEGALEGLAGKVLDRPVVIARGSLPKDGSDARVEVVDPNNAVAQGHAERAQSDTARVDFREVGRGPLSVQPGDVLARKVALTPAVDGHTVKGKTLPAKAPKDVELKRLTGQNTKVSDDGMAIEATSGGQVIRVGERVAVMPIHTVNGDVDFKTGNISFDGNIQVSGGVKPGFKVSATGAVTIGGTVEGAQIEAGGDVTISGGVVGQKEGVIRAGGNVTARFVQEAEIHAGGTVTIGSEIRESTVISEKKVTVGGQGRIVGGLVRGRDEVEARIAGSPSATPTTIQAGWGESLETVEDGQVHIPKVTIRNEVQPGVLLTVAGASQRFPRQSVGGVWREKERKLVFSAN